MRQLSIFSIVVFVMTATAAGADDAAITKQVAGKWTTCLAGGSATEADGTIHYADGGTFTAEGQVALGEGAKADVKVEGTWKVDAGSILYKVSKSTHPGLAPVGGVLKEQVVSIDNKQMTVKRGIGKERERKRVTE
jgi:hypothetical protein